MPSEGIDSDPVIRHCERMHLRRVPRSYEIEVDAPVDRVWNVVALEFDRIGEWASVISHSTRRDPHTDTDDQGPPKDRVCRTNLPGFGDVVETVIDYDDTSHGFTYTGSGLPGWIGTASNSWSVRSVGPGRTAVTFVPSVQSHGLLGQLLLPLFLRLGQKMARDLLDDLRTFVETGQPSPRKKRATRRRSHRVAA